ncbi:MAG: hypothetical protein KC441_10090, partial [Anaerolineales bacterium]|nr:hypothetical protein [Anaerolineales bacterium]
HGLPGKVLSSSLDNLEKIVLSNGPLLSNGLTILTESHPQAVTMLSERFLASDARLTENLQLLHRGEGIVVADSDVLFATWNGR